MMRRTRNSIKETFRRTQGQRKGVALIIVILVLAFMFAVGLALYSVTRSGPTVAGNMRWHQMAFNAAEAGVDAALNYINENMLDFMGRYRTTYNGLPGLGDPASSTYFRRLTDAQLDADIKNHPDNYIFSSVAMPDASQLTYTAFLVDNDGGAPVTNHMDALLVCIGQGPQNTSVRLEVVISIE
jgi:Tfp pilus assembly protein PilX